MLSKDYTMKILKKSNYRVWDYTYIGQNPMSREHKELNSVRKIK